MKYTIKNSDLFFNNKLYSEGSEIELSEEEIIGIEDFLIPISDINDSTKEVKPQLKLNSKGNKK